MVRIGREEPWATGRVPSHREDPRIVGVEDVPSVRACDPGDDGLHLRELVHRVDTVEPEVVLADVRDDRDVVVPDADAAQQHAAPRRLEHRDVGFLLECARRAAEPGVVARLDQHAVIAEDAVGRRVRDRLPGAPHQVRKQSHRGRLPVRAGHLDDGDVGIAHGRLVAGVDGDQAAARFSAISSVGRAPEQGGHPCGDLVPERLGGRAPAPRERDHDLVAGRAGPRAHGEPPRAAGHRDPAGEVRGQSRHHAASLFALWSPTAFTPAGTPSLPATVSRRSSDAPSQPGTASVSLIAGRVKYRFGPSSTRSSTIRTASATSGSGFDFFFFFFHAWNCMSGGVVDAIVPQLGVDDRDHAGTHDAREPPPDTTETVGVNHVATRPASKSPRRGPPVTTRWRSGKSCPPGCPGFPPA